MSGSAEGPPESTSTIAAFAVETCAGHAIHGSIQACEIVSTGIRAKNRAFGSMRAAYRLAGLVKLDGRRFGTLVCHLHRPACAFRRLTSPGCSVVVIEGTALTAAQWCGIGNDRTCVTVESYPVLSVTHGTLPVLTALAEHDSSVGIT